MDDPVAHRLRICRPRSVCPRYARVRRTASSPWLVRPSVSVACHQNEM